jgi:putative oxidoreductase
MLGFTLFLLYLGRFLLGAAFVVFGLRNIKSISGLTAAMEKKGLLPQPRLWMVAGVGIQIVGGLMVATGFLAWLGALALAAFLLLAAYLFHPFWEFKAEEQGPHINACIMNTGVAGASSSASAPWAVPRSISLPVAARR